MDSAHNLDNLDEQQLRALARQLMGEVAARNAQIAKRDLVIDVKQTHIDQLTHELAMYKRWRYGKRSEQLNAAQLSLLEETLDEDLATIEQELDALRETPVAKPQTQQGARRLRLPAALPRTDIHTMPL